MRCRDPRSACPIPGTCRKAARWRRTPAGSAPVRDRRRWCSQSELSRSRATALALLALFQPRICTCLVIAENRFLELQRDVFAHVGAALGARTTSATASAAEDIAKSKDVAEDVLEIDELDRIEPCRRRRSPTPRRDRSGRNARASRCRPAPHRPRCTP